MINLLVLGILFLSTSCAQSVKKEEMVIRPGEVRWVEFPATGSKLEFRCRDQFIKFKEVNGKVMALVVESYFSDLGPFKCLLSSQNEVLYELSFRVEKREYPSEQLRVDSKKIKLSPKDEKRVMDEQVVLNKIYASSLSEILFQKPFGQPMLSAITSQYGTARVYNKQKKGQHLGIDYRANIGEKVPAANAGKIVYAGDLFYTGWTVIIDHGLDIFSVYGHLSKTVVDVGQVVQKGDLIGFSGNTGRTSGPHLHWGVKVQGQYVDGLVLIEESQKYFRE